MSRAALPNLELLERQAIIVIKGDETTAKKIKNRHEERIPVHWRNKSIQTTILEREEGFDGISSQWMDITCDVFIQTWGSTCTAFDVMPDGSAAVGGDAMTDAYTVVFHEHVSDAYVVFVNNRLCYMVQNPTDAFLKDLKHRNLRSLSEAKRRY